MSAKDHRPPIFKCNQHRWDDWEKDFSRVIIPLVDGTETPEELQDFGWMLGQVAAFFETSLGANEVDLGACVSGLWIKLKEPRFFEGDIDLPAFADRLRDDNDPVYRSINKEGQKRLRAKLTLYTGAASNPDLEKALRRILNRILGKDEFYKGLGNLGSNLSIETQDPVAMVPMERKTARFNRLLLSKIYPLEISQSVRIPLEYFAEKAREGHWAWAWNSFVDVIRNEISSTFRSGRRYKETVKQLEEILPSGEDGASLFENMTADSSPGPNFLALFNDDWKQWLAIVSAYPKQGDAMVYKAWIWGDRIKDIAEGLDVTENTIQLAVGRVRKFVLIAVLKQESKCVEMCVSRYSEPAHLPMFRKWRDGTNVRTIAKIERRTEPEVKNAIDKVIEFICHDWKVRKESQSPNV